jgi:hypothetical protein
VCRIRPESDCRLVNRVAKFVRAGAARSDATRVKTALIVLHRESCPLGSEACTKTRDDSKIVLELANPIFGMGAGSFRQRVGKTITSKPTEIQQHIIARAG